MTGRVCSGLWPAGFRSHLRRSVLVGFFCILAVLMAAGPAQAQSSGAGYSGGADIPPEYLQQYQYWGAYYGLDWTILAAIGKVESDHGAYGSVVEGCILGPPTPYGSAYGPMQFLISSWEFSAVDGSGNGLFDSCDYRDAIPSSANYLRIHGAPEDYYGAIYAYNRSYAYVEAVLAEARGYYQLYG